MNSVFKYILFTTLMVLSVTKATAQGNGSPFPWIAGNTMGTEMIKTYGGTDRCFAAEPIPDRVWERMQGKSYKKNPDIGRDNLRYLRVLHWDYDNKIHTGEMVCNKKIADILLKIFRQLYDARYPIQRMVLPDNYDTDDEKQMQANNSSCFCYRVVAGSKVLSKHSLGLAVDINTLYNPYVKQRKDGTLYIQPATAKQYVDRTKPFKYKIDRNDLCYKLFTENGFTWGGSWNSCKDYQHFEFSK